MIPLRRQPTWLRRLHRDIRALDPAGRGLGLLFPAGLIASVCAGLAQEAHSVLKGDPTGACIEEGVLGIMFAALAMLIVTAAADCLGFAVRRAAYWRMVRDHHMAKAMSTYAEKRLAYDEYMRAKTLEAMRAIEQHARKIHGEQWKRPEA